MQGSSGDVWGRTLRLKVAFRWGCLCNTAQVWCSSSLSSDIATSVPKWPEPSQVAGWRFPVRAMSKNVFLVVAFCSFLLEGFQLVSLHATDGGELFARCHLTQVASHPFIPPGSLRLVSGTRPYK